MSPERLADLRRYAERHNPDTERRWEAEQFQYRVTDRHLYDGGCPWCRADEVGPPHHAGNAHDTALELLDEVVRLRAAATVAREVLLDEFGQDLQHEDEVRYVVDLLAAAVATGPIPERTQ